MSQEAVVEIISKAVLDTDFRQQLLTKSEATLAEYDLTTQEKADFSKLTPEAFDAFASDVEQRLSKSGLLMNTNNILESLFATSPSTAASLGLGFR